MFRRFTHSMSTASQWGEHAPGKATKHASTQALANQYHLFLKNF